MWCHWSEAILDPFFRASSSTSKLHSNIEFCGFFATTVISCRISNSGPLSVVRIPSDFTSAYVLIFHEGPNADVFSLTPLRSKTRKLSWRHHALPIPASCCATTNMLFTVPSNKICSTTPRPALLSLASPHFSRFVEMSKRLAVLLTMWRR